ncbi:MAG: endonuclease NucS domain-containing protein [Limnohabitans sp.]|uniref:endonuclease NucS domain-containing protein n=1 Tax=Limnohabitans sp. TaxID=1907725 RepID=UPI003BB0DF64
MKAYNRVMAGPRSVYAAQCFNEGFIGIDYEMPIDFTGRLPENWRDFNREFVPVYLEGHPNKSKIAAGLACGFIWTLSKGLQQGDIVITPNGERRYKAGEITSDYYYVPGNVLPHRRKVRWFPDLFDRDDMSHDLQRTTNSTGTCCDLKAHAEEVERLIGGQRPPAIIASDPTIEDPAVFAIEKHLEDFLVSNWEGTELGRKYDIYAVDGERVGQQYPTDTGPVDILAISKDGTELLVVELKKGRASDVVVGQIQRYMGYVLDELAEEHQRVKGVIIALEDDTRIRRALRVTQGIDFFRYRVNFTLIPASAG